MDYPLLIVSPQSPWPKNQLFKLNLKILRVQIGIWKYSNKQNFVYSMIGKLSSQCENKVVEGDTTLCRMSVSARQPRHSVEMAQHEEMSNI